MSYTQIFMTRICFNKLFQISETGNTEYLTPSLLNRVPYVPAWSTCPRAHVPTCQKRSNFSFLRANVPRRAKILTWRANVPKGVPFFQLRLPKAVTIFQLFFKRIMLFYIPNKYIPDIFYIFCIF